MTPLRILILATLIPVFTYGQGSLNPPGAPAPLMKSLDQIEPRTPIAALPYVITVSGSYYVVTNLVQTGGGDGIIITTNNITLDLNGFTLFGKGGGHGVLISASHTNIVIRNGTVTGWGNGVDGFSFDYPRNVTYERLTLSDNTMHGLMTEADARVRDCLAMHNGVNGYFSYGSIMTGCTARDNGAYGFLVYNSILHSCSAQNNGSGMWLENSQVSDCDIIGNTTNGVFLSSTCRFAQNRVANHNSAANGIAVTVQSSRNVVQNNALVNNTEGLYVTSQNNIIIQNTCSGNVTPYNVQLNNIFPAAIVGTSLGNTFTNVNPWVNTFY